MRRIYLDHAATSPVRPEVRTAVEPILFGSAEEGFGNASSVHWAGQSARRHLEQARSRVARVLSVAPSEVTFTSGGTEADNLALTAAAGGRLVLSAVEHPAVRAPAQTRHDVVEIGVDARGRLDLEGLGEALGAGASLVSVMAVNNETGIVHDLDGVRALTRAAGVPLHVDAVQAAGRLPPAQYGAELVTLSGHKLGGLPGAGVLVVRGGARVDPVLLGGPQERGRRAGTEPVAAAVALSVALELAEAERALEGERISALSARLEAGVLALPGVRALEGDSRVPGIRTFLFEGVDGEALLQALDLDGIAVSSGSACSSGSLEPSHVLLAMGVDPRLALSSVRFSLGRTTTALDVEETLERLPGLLERARAVAQDSPAAYPMA